VENLAFNRRYWLDDGKLAWNPPKLDPRIVAPAGPHDPQVGVLAFDSLEKVPRPLATWVNYAMHPDTTGGLKISADYPGHCARALASVRDGVTLVANGCCGNLNHRNVWSADPQKGPQESARLAQILAGAVSETLPRLVPVNASPRIRSAMVKLPLPEITDADRDAARATVRRASEAKFMEQVQTFKVLDVLAREGRPQEVEVQVISLGDEVAVVALPGEIFVELGLEIKRRSPFRHTHLVELANGAIGYIPNRSAYPEGGYEVVSSRVAAGGGELLVEAAVTLLRELKHDPPRRPAAALRHRFRRTARRRRPDRYHAGLPRALERIRVSASRVGGRDAAHSRQGHRLRRWPGADHHRQSRRARRHHPRRRGAAGAAE
jgi:hypothetical protein